ncbi:hypothetical protein CIB84_002011 [Bambusicola thoracicus]|uniref:Uncharacterized protein n=1 Tax=Bambusicola thoracicus TaxID=9083 RepID=A0A2P4TD35_BAMTH|nr:hypothetical protein CIB84_002011 [Bambusicola thoracicus]
MLQETIAVTKR